MKIVTHNGHFHTDDLMAVATLLLKYPQAEVVRTRDESVIASGDIVVDVGQVYDPAKLRFDHHQAEGAGKRENGIPYASFGLVWKHLGEELAGGKDEAEIIERKLVVGVDALDNGVDIQTPKYEGVEEYSLKNFFQSFVDLSGSMEELDKTFLEIVPMAKGILEREIKIAQKLVSDWREVRRIYDESETKQLIVLPESLSWKQVLVPSEALYVVYPRDDARWGLQAINSQLGSFELKKPLPEKWRGLSGEELIRASGVEDAVFCHRAGFMAVAQSREGALELAKFALNS